MIANAQRSDDTGTMPADLDDDLTADGLTSDLDAVMRAARVISAIVAESVAQTGDAVTMPQLRTLVLVATRGDVNATAVADSLGIHPSNASRLCERLVQSGLLDRQDDPRDRRNVALRLTEQGSELVRSVMEHRRAAFRVIVEAMSDAGRSHLRAGLEEFAVSAAEPAEGWELML